MTDFADFAFGRVITAMVTPFHPDGSLDLDGAAKLAKHLVKLGNDALVVSGTTGESPTTTPAEDAQLLETVVAAVGKQATIIAGVGTNHTDVSVDLAQQAAQIGADGLLIVTPYYNRPTQAGLVAHFTKVTESTHLPVMLYDIPGRTGTPIESDTIRELAQHRQIIAMKDAKGDLFAAQQLMAETGLHWYSGDDVINLAHLAQGAVGVVSVIGHLVADRLQRMIAALDTGDLGQAQQINRSLIPVTRAIMTRMPGVMAVKAALALQGLPAGPVRLPLVSADTAQIEAMKKDLIAGGVPVTAAELEKHIEVYN